MDKLLRTSLYQAISKSLNRRKVSEARLQTCFSEFVRQATIICDELDCLSALRILNYTQIQFQSLSRRITELSISPPQYIARFIGLAIEFIRMEKDLLYYRIEHPQSFIFEPSFNSPLYWSEHYPAIGVSEILCGLDRMTPKPLLLADGTTAPFNLIVRVFEHTFNIHLGDPSDAKRRVLDRKKDRTKFTEALLYAINKEDR